MSLESRIRGCVNHQGDVSLHGSPLCSPRATATNPLRKFCSLAVSPGKRVFLRRESRNFRYRSVRVCNAYKHSRLKKLQPGWESPNRMLATTGVRHQILVRLPEMHRLRILLPRQHTGISGGSAARIRESTLVRMTTHFMNGSVGGGARPLALSGRSCNQRAAKATVRNSHKSDQRERNDGTTSLDMRFRSRMFGEHKEDANTTSLAGTVGSVGSDLGWERGELRRVLGTRDAS